jgi:DNA primase
LKGVTKPIMGLDSADPKRVTVVLEGIFCAYSLRQRGLQTLAVMGTALRGARAQALRPFGNIIFIPQNDEPDAKGVHAGDAAVEVWRGEVGKGRIIRLPGSIKDVNDLDQAGGLDEWLQTWATWLHKDQQ